MKKIITKTYYAIKGFFIERKMQKGKYYISKHISNSRFMYRGKRTFYKAFTAMCGPATYTSQEEKTYKFWEIGVLDFKKS